MDFPPDRRLSDAEIAIGVSESILDSKFNPGMNLPFQPGEFILRLGKQTRDLPQGFHDANPHRELEFRVAAYCWRLVGLGYLVPQVSSGWGVFYPTEAGKAFLGDFDPATITVGGMDTKLGAMGFTESDLPRQYVRQAQDCFLAGHHEASVVMLGAAAEALIQQVADALDAALSMSTTPLRARPNRPTARQNLSWTTEAVTTHRRDLAKAMTAKGVDSLWIEPLADLLPGTGQAIRLTRNELGHPTGITVSQEDAMQLMALFPRFAETCLRAVDALT
jgi:hypothetical protein